MSNIATRVILFLSSYAPLFLIIAMRGWSDSRYLAAGIALIAVLSVAVLFAFLRTARKVEADKVKVDSVVSRGGWVQLESKTCR